MQVGYSGDGTVRELGLMQYQGGQYGAGSEQDPSERRS